MEFQLSIEYHRIADSANTGRMGVTAAISGCGESTLIICTSTYSTGLSMEKRGLNNQGSIVYILCESAWRKRDLCDSGK